ncbi:hypothetical protein [Amycolatopsis sp. WGS_07]|uniref:hypothetical protein n=1 Tax=Amycolatopsis sp. WGS_07 TaxID=3076764 RepID=UPI0038735C66
MTRPVSHRLLLRYGTIAAAAALVCTSCSGSGSGGTAAPPPASASPAASSSAVPSADPLDPAAIKAAMKKSTAVHVKGSASKKDGKMKVDLQFNKDSVSGSIEKDGVVVPVLRVGDKVWMKFSDSLAKSSGVPAAGAAMLRDKWVSLDSKLGQGLGEAFKLFLDFDIFVSSMASEADQPGYGFGQPADAAGTLALRYQNDDTTIFIEAVEPHRLLRMESPKEGTMEFTGWDQPVPAKAPPAEEIFSGPGS